MKKLVLALSAATLIVGIVAALLWRQLHTETDQLAALRSRVNAMESAQAAALASAAQAAPASAAIAATDASITAPPTSTGAATSTNPRDRTTGSIAAGVTSLLASPEARDMTRSLVRTALAQQYSDLAAELGLSPAETEKFLDLLARHASDSAGDAIGMLTIGNSPAALESQRKMVERQMANEKEVSRMLGSRYPQWQEYQGTQAAKQQVTQLRALLGSGEDALSEIQSKPLIIALGAEQTRINKEEQGRMNTAVRNSQNVMEEQLKNMSAQNERLVNAASPHLSINQLDRYKRMLGQQETMVRSIMGGANGQGSAAGLGGVPR